MENSDMKKGGKCVERGPPVDANFDSFFLFFIERPDDADVSILYLTDV